MPWPPDFAAAVAEASRADRLAPAFAAGYQAALRVLVPGTSGVASLLVTERGGNRPRDIETVLSDGRLTGEKTFATQGASAQTLFVLARAGNLSNARFILRLCRVAADAPGITVEPLPETPFVPEISHARVRLHEVPATSLEGEGWDDYVKPFRTIEDIHVVGAVLGYLSGVGARAGWARPVRQELAALVAMFAGLAAAAPTRGATHLGLAGALDLVRRTLATLDWTSVDPAERDRWLRDRRLLDVAEAARRARTEAAWASAAPDGDH